MAYAYYAPGTSPQYVPPIYYPRPPPSDYPYRPLTPVSPPKEPQKLRRKVRRSSFAGNSNAEYYHSQNAPVRPATLLQAKRVLWLADFMRSPVSAWYPGLHPVLAADTSLVNFDVRVTPRSAIDPHAYARFRGDCATSPPTKHMRLVSYDFPWVFELDYRELDLTHYVTCGDVWRALCTGLAEALTDAEWSLLLTSKDSDQSERTRAIERIVETRKFEEGRFARRTDWLGRNVIFRGLMKDDDYARRVLLPGREPCADTWVVKFASLKH